MKDKRAFPPRALQFELTRGGSIPSYVSISVRSHSISGHARRINVKGTDVPIIRPSSKSNSTVIEQHMGRPHPDAVN